MIRTLLSVFCMVFLLSACEETKVMVPAGFKHMYSAKTTHFVYIDTRVVSLREKVALRRAGKNICIINKNLDYCKVYMWDDPNLVSKNIPVENRKEVAVIYTWKNDKVTLKVIK